jgi:hypothetical protein
MRRLIETVIGQLVERFSIEKVWARDLWHLTSRINRKLLAHTVCRWLNRHNIEPLQLGGAENFSESHDEAPMSSKHWLKPIALVGLLRKCLKSPSY